MIDLDFTLLIQGLNFIIIWLVLNVLLFKPIRGIIAKRQEHIKKQVDDINDFASEAESKLANYEKTLAEARAAGVAERDKEKDAAQAQADEVVKAAQSDATDKVAEAKSEIESQFKAAKDALSKEVKEKAKLVAGKVLGQA
jgi:F-type H+-transporting ATPase subunit b